MNLPTVSNLVTKTDIELENALAAAHAYGSSASIDRLEAEVARRAWHVWN